MVPSDIPLSCRKTRTEGERCYSDRRDFRQKALSGAEAEEETKWEKGGRKIVEGWKEWIKLEKTDVKETAEDNEGEAEKGAGRW